MKKKDRSELVAGLSSLLAASAVGATVLGSSAAGITSGLSLVGSLVGGGMAAGVATVAAAPVVIGGVSYGLYKLLKNHRK